MRMKVNDLYKQFEVMPQLVTHQLRVAGVGKIIAENWKGKCDVKFTTELCLLHDMGNIVKFDLKNRDESKFGNIENIEYWQQIQQKYLNQFGKDAHDATVGIIKQAKLDKFIPYIFEEEKLYFAEAKEIELSRASLPAIILMYADCRVIPKGVVSYRERIDDLKARYGGVGTTTWYNWTYWFEEWMQKKVNIDLHEITEQMVAPLFDDLLTHEIE
jgi:hypothetical protein